MKVSRFQKWKKTIPQQLVLFSVDADKDVGDDEWEMPIHRHSAAEILVWILDKTGATLRKGQLVEAWVAVVRQCWNLMDTDRYTDRNRHLIMCEIEYFVKKAKYKKEEEAERKLAKAKRKDQQRVLTSTISGGVRRIRRVVPDVSWASQVPSSTVAFRLSGA